MSETPMTPEQAEKRDTYIAALAGITVDELRAAHPSVRRLFRTTFGEKADAAVAVSDTENNARVQRLLDEITHLRAELAARPTRAAVLREVAALWSERSTSVSLPRERMDLRYRAAELREMADTAERDDAGKGTPAGGESTRRPLLDPRSCDAPVQRAAARDLNRERTERGDAR